MKFKNIFKKSPKTEVKTTHVEKVEKTQLSKIAGGTEVDDDGGRRAVMSGHSGGWSK